MADTRLQTHYQTLQVTETASDEVVRGAYRHLSQRWHPDKNPDQRDDSERLTAELNDAYAVLSDPHKRHEYDAWLAGQRGAASMPPESPGPPVRAPADPGHPLLSAARWLVYFPAGLLGGLLLPGLWLGLGIWLVGNWAIPSAVVVFLATAGIPVGTVMVGLKVAPAGPSRSVKWVMLAPLLLVCLLLSFELVFGDAASRPLMDEELPTVLPAWLQNAAYCTGLIVGLVAVAATSPDELLDLWD